MRAAAAVGILGLWVGGVGGEELKVSESGHYLVYDGRPLLLVGDSGTQCVMQNLNLDYRAWVSDCAERGIRAVHIWSFLAARQTQDGRVIEGRYGYLYPAVAPWPRKEGGPLAADGLPQFDLTRFDEGSDARRHYWPRLRNLCECARERGIVVGITVFFGWPKHNSESRSDWRYHPLNAINGGPVRDEGRIITGCQRIEWPGRETFGEPYDEDWPQGAKVQWVWERFADKLIGETNGYGNVFYCFMDEHSYPEGNCGDHFARFFRRRGALWADWDRRREEVDLVYGPTSEAEDKNELARRHLGRTPARPYVFLEGGPYVGEGMRTGMWTCLIGGGHFFYHNDAGQETPQTGIMGYDLHVEGGDKGMTRRDWLGHASRFFNERLRHLDEMAPANHLILEGDAYCLAAPGREYAVYSAEGDSFALDLSAAGGRRMAAGFHDPRTGEAKPIEGFVAAGDRRFVKPDGRDWALHVVAEGGGGR